MVTKAPSISLKSGMVAYALVGLTLAICAGSLIVFYVFLYVGPFGTVDLDLGLPQALVFNSFLCAAFFLQHSGMIRKSARRRMSQVISEHYLGAVFSIASGITLLALVLLWQETPIVLASADGFYRWSFRAVFFLAVAIQMWGTWAWKSSDLLGTESVLRRSDPTSLPAPMVVRGLYRWVRHPLYLATLMMIWSYPDLTADRLLFNVLFTGWIIVGTVLEERDLVENFGDDYRNYQRRVPMLIPYRKPIEGVIP